MTQYIEQGQKSKKPQKNQTPQPQEVKSQQTNRVDLSDQSKEMKKIYTVQQIAPDIRTEKVNEVKKLIEQNRYKVDSQAVAEKMIRESILELKR
jgi:flagellar biosynthesis anti-sigma factor FlgM